MKGRDLLADHLSATAQLAATGEIVAAPAAGFAIVVFKIFISANAAMIVDVGDVTQGTLWETVLGANGNGQDADEFGLFTCTEAESFDLLVLSAGTVRINVTYEVRPVGM